MPYDVVQTSAADTLPPVRRFDFLEAVLPRHGDGKRRAAPFRGGRPWCASPPSAGLAGKLVSVGAT
jgi:hypothetical protein